jgi:hypothetical protein
VGGKGGGGGQGGEMTQALYAHMNNKTIKIKKNNKKKKTGLAKQASIKEEGDRQVQLNPGRQIL